MVQVAQKTQTIVEDKQREFIVKEPTAFTLDRLSMEYIELIIDENKLKKHQDRRHAGYLQHITSVWQRLWQ